MLKTPIHICALLLLWFVLAFEASGNSVPQITPKKFYSRCHIQFTGDLPPLDPSRVVAEFPGDPTPGLYVEFKNRVDAASSLEAVREVCLTILDSAELDPTPGVNQGRLRVPSALGHKVLRHFHSFFQTWGSNRSFSAVVPNDGFRAERNFYRHPLASMLTYLLFTPGKDYAELVSGAPVERLGALGYRNTELVVRQTDPNQVDPGAPDPEPFMNWPDYLQFQEGFLLGFLRNDSMVHPVSGTPLPDLMVNLHSFVIPNGAYPYRRGTGAGILSDPAWMLLQYPAKEVNSKAVSADSLWRRYAQAVYSELLCNDLPVMDFARAQRFTRELGSTGVSYWEGESCMTCHAGMDTLAAGVRNYAFHAQLRHGDTDVMTTHMAKWPVMVTEPMDLGRNERLPAEAPDFYQRQPYGVFRLLSYSGAFIEKNFLDLHGPEGLGQVLANTDEFYDLYTCAASRIYAHMTHIKVSLKPYAMGIVPTETDIHYRGRVHTLGQSLKEKAEWGGQLRQVFREILYSDQYSRTNFRDLGF